MMKFMKFHQSDEYYEVKDPDLLRMKKQNESLKNALNEANQSVKQIQNLFETQTVFFKFFSMSQSSFIGWKYCQKFVLDADFVETGERAEDSRRSNGAYHSEQGSAKYKYSDTPE